MTWDKDKNEAEQFQDYVRKTLWETGIPVEFYQSRKFQLKYGEGPSGIEVKLDRKWRDTGNFYIEISSKRMNGVGEGEYFPSGIYRDPLIWLWALGDEGEFFLIQKTILQLLHRSRRYQERECKRDGDVPTRGFLLPRARMIECSGRRYVQGKLVPCPDIQNSQDSPTTPDVQFTCGECGGLSYEVDGMGRCINCQLRDRWQEEGIISERSEDA